MARKRYKPEEIVGLWLNDGSCIRLRAERADHTWSYDFVHCRTHDGRTAFIAPGSPWENGYIESFNARLRDALLRHFLAAPFQRHPPAQQPGIPAAGPGNDRRAKLAARLRCAPPTIQLGGETVNALTFEPDQSPGAGHTRSSEKEHPWRLLRIPMSFRALWQGSRVSCASSGIYFS